MCNSFLYTLLPHNRYKDGDTDSNNCCNDHSCNNRNKAANFWTWIFTIVSFGPLAYLTTHALLPTGPVNHVSRSLSSQKYFRRCFCKFSKLLHPSGICNKHFSTFICLVLLMSPTPMVFKVGSEREGLHDGFNVCDFVTLVFYCRGVLLYLPFRCCLVRPLPLKLLWTTLLVHSPITLLLFSLVFASSAVGSLAA